MNYKNRGTRESLHHVFWAAVLVTLWLLAHNLYW